MTQQTYKNCQSCGMSLTKDTQGGGTEKDEKKVQNMVAIFTQTDNLMVEM